MVTMTTMVMMMSTSRRRGSQVWSLIFTLAVCAHDRSPTENGQNHNSSFKMFLMLIISIPPHCLTTARFLLP